MKFDYSYISDKGGRAENQDQYGQVILSNGKSACFVVADGLGGHRGGQIASSVAVGTVLEEFSRADLNDVPLFLANALTRANAAICAEQQKDRETGQMRSTCAVLVVHDGLAWWAHVGDTRVYHFIGGVLMDCTKDHSVVQMMVDMGDISPEEMRGHAERNRIIRSLGNPESFSPTVRTEGVPVTNATSFVLCTDGFWEIVLEDELGTLLRRSANAKVALDACEKRIKTKLKPESDNYTAQVIRFPNAPKPDRLPRKIKADSRSAGMSVMKGRLALLATSAITALLVVLLLVLGAKMLLKPDPKVGPVDAARASFEEKVRMSKEVLQDYAPNSHEEIERLRDEAEKNQETDPKAYERAENKLSQYIEKANQAKGKIDGQKNLLEKSERRAKESRAQADKDIVHAYAQSEWDLAEATIKGAQDSKNAAFEDTPVDQRFDKLNEASNQFDKAAEEYDSSLKLAKEKSEALTQTPQAEGERANEPVSRSTQEGEILEGEKETDKGGDPVATNPTQDDAQAARKSADLARDQARESGANGNHKYFSKAQRPYNEAVNALTEGKTVSAIKSFKSAKEYFDAANAQARVERLLSGTPNWRASNEGPKIAGLIDSAQEAIKAVAAKDYYQQAEELLKSIQAGRPEGEPESIPVVPATESEAAREVAEKEVELESTQAVSGAELKAARQAADRAKATAQRNNAQEPVKGGDLFYSQAQKLESTDPKEALRLYKEAAGKYSAYRVRKPPTAQNNPDVTSEAPAPPLVPSGTGAEEESRDEVVPTGQTPLTETPGPDPTPNPDNAVQGMEPPNLVGHEDKGLAERVFGSN